MLKSSPSYFSHVNIFGESIFKETNLVKRDILGGPGSNMITVFIRKIISTIYPYIAEACKKTDQS